MRSTAALRGVRQRRPLLLRLGRRGRRLGDVVGVGLAHGAELVAGGRLDHGVRPATSVDPRAALEDLALPGDSVQQSHRPTLSVSPTLPRRSPRPAAAWPAPASTVSSLPSTVEENPHCGERQSCSIGTNFAASSMRRFRSSLSSSCAGLGGDQAEHDLLALGHEAQRLEAAGPLVVVLEEEAVDVELREQHLGHEVVAALGRPRRPEVAAAHVRGHPQAVRPAGDRGVDVLHVLLVQVVGVAALRGDQRALLRVVEVGEAGVVELEVGAAELGHPPHLLGVRRGEVGPERLEVRVDRLVDRGPAAAVVDHVRRGDGQLRDLVALDHRLQERERVAEDRVPEPDPVVDAQRGGLEVEVAALVVEVHRQLLVGRVDTLELVDEVHVPRRTPELAVGRRTDAGLALERDDVADRGVLDLSQAVVVELARPVSGAGGEEVRRSEQASDVVGTERRERADGHVFERTRAGRCSMRSWTVRNPS